MAKLELKRREVDGLVAVFAKALDVAQRIARCEEIPALLEGFSASFIEPGASGAITRGKFEILPTGRNFYAVDPRMLPTRAAWEVGVKTAHKMLNYYLEKHGRYPESVGHVLWSIDAYKADGEQLAQILYLLGVRPVWGPDGAVQGLEVIPLDELKRPRIDCVTRISGIVRDTLPNYPYLIDDAVEKVVVLDEPLDLNFVRKHYIEYVRELLRLGRSVEDARVAARYRVFCSPPGSYGAGVNYAVEASAWEEDEDLAKTWVQWAGYAYGKSSHGAKAHDVLVLTLKDVDAVSRSHPSDEHDLLACCCYFAYHGGFFNSAKAISGKDIDAIHVDTRDLSNLDVRDVKVEIERVVRAKLLNPAWIEEMKKHGYRGANEFSKKILHLYGWSATTKLVEDWVFDEIAKTYALNEEMRKWFEEHNVWSLEEIVRRLVEAAERNLWRPPNELLEQLREVYAELEGILEETAVGEGDRQGGSINIITAEAVDHWKNSILEVEAIWRRVKQEAGS